jgi:RNA polymerase sigma-70 factor (ECF subfamily)
MTQDEVSALVEKSRAGDREAFSSLVLLHQDAVYNMAFQRLGDADAALDAAQETFVKAFSQLAKFRGESSFKTWLLSIALNEAANQHRSRRRHRAGSLEGREGVLPIPDQTPSPTAALETLDEVALVQRALQEADEDDAKLILLRDLENLSYGEIATVLQVPVGTVKSGLNRARGRLRAALERSMAPDKVA